MMLCLFLLCQIILTLISQTLCYEPTTEDLICFNDYEKEMKCSLPSDSLIRCSAYKLNIKQADTYTSCNFESRNGSCECTIQVQAFVIMETISATLLEGTKVLLSKEFITEETIKPKTPIISINKTEHGIFRVTWDDKYEKKDLIFVRSLRITLTYGIKGEHETVFNEVENTEGIYDIVSSNLKPNTDYILTAKMSTEYNDHKIFSDQSEPIQFTTPSSPDEIVKLVVPLLCIGLFIIISIMFVCFLRMKTNWWDKISKPKIAANFEERKNKFLDPLLSLSSSPIIVEVPQCDPQEKKILISPLSLDTNQERSSHSVESSPVDYGQACTDSGNEQGMNNITLRIAQAMSEDFKRFTCPSTNKPVKQDTTSDSYRAHRDSGNGSGSSNFSNMSYDSEFLQRPNSGQSNKKKLSGSWENIDISKSQFNSPINDLVEDGYQPFKAVLDKVNDVDDDDDDERLNVKNLITSKNPLYPNQIHNDCTSDDQYQAFEGLTKSSEGQWVTGIGTEQALKECGAFSLHMSPVLETDSSYQTF